MEQLTARALTVSAGRIDQNEVERMIADFRTVDARTLKALGALSDADLLDKMRWMATCRR